MGEDMHGKHFDKTYLIYNAAKLKEHSKGRFIVKLGGGDGGSKISMFVVKITQRLFFNGIS